MKDRSLLFFLAIFGGFAVFGSMLFFRVSPETLPERSRVALQTAGFRGITVTFDNDRAFLLGEAPTANDLAQAAEVVARVKGVSSVDVSHATLKRRLESPHMSLAFVGDQISVRGQVSSAEAKGEILSVLKGKYPEAKIDADRFVVRENVEDFGGFTDAPGKIPGVGELERERGVVAAVGGDAVWEVLPSGAGLEKITAGLTKVLPESEVAETLDDFDDVQTAKDLMDDNGELRGELAELKETLSDKEKTVRSLEVAVEESRKELGETKELAQATEVMLSMTKDELKKREGELGEMRIELMAKVRALAEADARRSVLETELNAAVESLEAGKVALAESRAREASAMATVDKMKSERAEVDALAVRQTTELTAIRKQHAEVKANLESALEKQRAEAVRLEGALGKAEAKAAELELKVGKMTLARPTPESVANAGAPNLERGKEVDAVRGAAAKAAESAREAAEGSVGRAKELNKSRGESNAPDAAGKDEAGPSGKPTPGASDVRRAKLEAVGGYSAKNVGESASGEPGDIKGAEKLGKTEALYKELELKDRRILDLQRRIEAERKADGAVIAVLRQENAALHEALDQANVEEGAKAEITPESDVRKDADGDAGEPGFEGEETGGLADPVTPVFAAVGGR